MLCSLERWIHLLILGWFKLPPILVSSVIEHVTNTIPMSLKPSQILLPILMSLNTALTHTDVSLKLVTNIVTTTVIEAVTNTDLPLKLSTVPKNLSFSLWNCRQHQSVIESCVMGVAVLQLISSYSCWLQWDPTSLSMIEAKVCLNSGLVLTLSQSSTCLEYFVDQKAISM